MNWGGGVESNTGKRVKHAKSSEYADAPKDVNVCKSMSTNAELRYNMLKCTRKCRKHGKRGKDEIT